MHNYLSSKKAQDEAIIYRVLEGDREAFAVLIKRYGKFVEAIAAKHVPPSWVADVAQETFLKAFRSLNGIERPNLFKQWLGTIAVRSCYDFLRRHYREQEVSLNSLGDNHRRLLSQFIAQTSDEFWQDKQNRNQAHEILNWAFKQLGAKDSMVLKLVHLEEMSIRDVAQTMGWSIANVKVRAFRARKKLCKILIEQKRDL